MRAIKGVPKAQNELLSMKEKITALNRLRLLFNAYLKVASFKSKYLDKNYSSRLLINFHYALNEKLFDNSSNINKTKTLYNY